MPKPLTARAVDLTKPDPAKRLEILDGHLPGIYLLAQPTAGRT